MTQRNIAVHVDLLQNNDTSLPDAMATRIHARPDENLYKETSSGNSVIITTGLFFEDVTIDGQAVKRMRVSDGNI